jgi:hypothetical protein
MYRIRIFSDFCNESYSKDLFEKMYETHLMNEYAKDKEIYITMEDDYTHALIFNQAMPNLLSTVSKQNVIGFSHEPFKNLNLRKNFMDYAEKYISKYFMGDFGGYNLPDPFIQGNPYLWHNIPRTISDKKKMMSIMISEKIQAPGHKYRHELVKEILNTNFPIDIYGRGCFYYKGVNDSRIKGSFNESGHFYESYNMCEDYNFHICIENFQTEHYFSEKIINSLISNCSPIYLGCRNIEKYFPNNVIYLTGDVKQDVVLLENIIKNPDAHKKQIDVPKIKDELNLLKQLKKLFA